MTTAGWQRLLIEPARPERVRTLSNAHWLVVASVCVGAFMGQLDASIVTLATPALQQHFGISLAAASWVALSYLLTLVAAVVPIGRLADAVGRKMLYVYGFGVFTLASVGCALAPSIGALDALRVVQAIGAAMLQANSVALIRLAMPPGQVGRGIGVQAVAQALGLALGPTVGGLLVHLGGWRLVFLVNAPVGVVGIAAGLVFLPRSRQLRHIDRMDYRGLLFFIPVVVGALLTLTNAQHGSLFRPAVVAPIAVAVAAGLALGRHTKALLRHGAEPLLPVDLFAHRDFSRAILAGLLSYLILFGMLFITPFQMERTLGWRPDSTGLLLTILPACIAISTPFAGRLADAKGTRLPTAIGMVLATAGFAVVATTPASVAMVAIALAIVGLGSGMFTPANNAAIMTSAPAARASVAGGVLNMTRAFGTALGVAVTSLAYAIAGAGSGGYRVATGCLAALAVLAAIVVTATQIKTSVDPTELLG
jgi:EmrB/QacA subfamily drug resistance transporter